MLKHADLGLLGQNISYSKSPTIHKESAKFMGISCSYEIFDKAPEEVEEFLRIQSGGRLLGLNVTQPFKETVAKLVGAETQSVNTLKWENNRWNGYSTDGIGLLNAAARGGFDSNKSNKIVILGAGGAVISLLERLKESCDLRQVKVLRRSNSRDEALARTGLDRESILPLDADQLSDSLSVCGANSLLVQGTSGPLHGDDLSALVPALQGFAGLLLDMVYSKPSALYDYALSSGIKCQDGLPMLIEQALESQSLWWGGKGNYDHLLQLFRGN